LIHEIPPTGQRATGENCPVFRHIWQFVSIVHIYLLLEFNHTYVCVI